MDTIWQKVSAVVGRQNMGARLFNVASMLSNILTLRGQRQLVLHLVNYSDYPTSGITARVPAFIVMRGFTGRAKRRWISTRKRWRTAPGSPSISAS